MKGDLVGNGQTSCQQKYEEKHNHHTLSYDYIEPVHTLSAIFLFHFSLPFQSVKPSFPESNSD